MAAVLAFVLFAYRGGVDSYLRVNDHLDGLIPAYRLLAEQPLLGPLDARIDAVMGGISRNSLRTTLNLGTLPYLWLHPVLAQALVETITRLVAFFGMLLLLRRRWLRDGSDAVVVGASLAFALLPFLPAGHLSVAGQPWLLHAILSVREGRARAGDWVFLGVFPLFSSLVYVGAYVVLALGGLLALDLVRARRISWRLVGALTLVGGLYAVSEYRLLYQSLLAEGYVSFRVEWDHRRQSFLTWAYNAVRMFLFSQHHAAAAQFPFIHLTVVLALGAVVLDAARRGTLGTLLREPLRASSWAHPSRAFAVVLAVGLAGLLAIGVGVYNWEVTQDLIRQSGIPILRMFGFHRFQWLHPLLFGLAFAWSLDLLCRHHVRGRALATVLLGLQLGWLVWTGDSLREQRESGLTFREFYSPALFAEIRDHIGRPPDEYRIASFALIPGIPLYNGFHTVGGFLSNYPLEYKHRFREVIAPELERDPFLRDVYDKWGTHVHLYSSELGMIVGYRKRGYWTKDQPVRAVHELRFDAEALRGLGAEYVLSAVEIEGHERLGLRFVRRFERDDSPWEIYLYAL